MEEIEHCLCSYFLGGKIRTPKLAAILLSSQKSSCGSESKEVPTTAPPFLGNSATHSLKNSVLLGSHGETLSQRETWLFTPGIVQGSAILLLSSSCKSHLHGEGSREGHRLMRKWAAQVEFQVQEIEGPWLQRRSEQGLGDWCGAE